MSFIDHQTREINVKVVWLADGTVDLAALESRLWKLRSKATRQHLATDQGEVELLALRLPPYAKVHGYRIRFHLFAPTVEVPRDEELWRGVDAVVAAPDQDVPQGVVRVERTRGTDVIALARQLSAAVVEALTAEGDDEPQCDAAEVEYLHVGPLPFLINLEGLEPRVDQDEERTRLVIQTPNRYDVLVLVYPAGTGTDDLIEQATQNWGSPQVSDGPTLAGFPSTRALFGPTDGGDRWEFLVVPLRDSLLVVTLREMAGAEAIEELRRYFLAMVEGAILRSSENRP